MNKVTKLALGIMSSGCILLAGCGWPDPTEYSYTFEQTDQYAQELLKTHEGASLSVALTVDGTVLLAKGYGLANAETGQPVATDTMYGIGSSSKMFATAAIMKLVDAGKIDLDKPVTTYLPEFSMASPEYTQITVRMLLNHSSGFPGTNYRGAGTTGPITWPAYADQVLATLRMDHLKHMPGYMSVYCNDGFTVAEKIVAALSGKSYAQFLRDEFFKPLGMKHSRYPTEYFPDGSFARKFSDGKVLPQEFVNTFGSGGLYSTPTDLCHFLAMLASEGWFEGQQILSRSAVAAMGTDQVSGTFRVLESQKLRYGLGWDSVAQPGLRAVGKTAWVKGGDTLYYGSCILVVPGEGLGAAVIGVGGIGSSDAEKLCERMLMAALVDRGRLAAIPAPLPQTPLAEAAVDRDYLDLVTGYYADYCLFLQVTADNGTLTISKRELDGWSVVKSGLKYRVNGWFSSDESPTEEFAFSVAEGRWYLVAQAPDGNGHYRTSYPFAERIAAGGQLSAAWQSRLGKTWLMANAWPVSGVWTSGDDPRLRIFEFDELKGLLWVNAPTAEMPALGLIDPSTSDQWGKNPVQIPILTGRDQHELQALQIAGEEWIRYSGTFYRPLETVPALAAGQIQTFIIGPEGYSQWFRLTPASSTCTITLTAAPDVRWSLYDQQYEQLSEGWGAATLVQPAWSEGDLLLAVTGNPGQQITVSRSP